MLHSGGDEVCGWRRPDARQGINYDTGFMPGNHSSPTLTRRLQRRRSASSRAISAARRSGSPAPTRSGSTSPRGPRPAEGLEVWFSPFPVELPAADLIGLFRDCAGRAERLRREGAAVVLVIGCELTLFCPGYLPGAFFYDRIRRLARPSPRQLLSFARLPKRLNAFLAGAAEAARRQFGGSLTYAAAAWEPVDWSRFGEPRPGQRGAGRTRQRLPGPGLAAPTGVRRAGPAPGELTFPVQRLLRQYWPGDRPRDGETVAGGL
jgi:hypothetical protein